MDVENEIEAHVQRWATEGRNESGEIFLYVLLAKDESEQFVSYKVTRTSEGVENKTPFTLGTYPNLYKAGLEKLWNFYTTYGDLDKIQYQAEKDILLHLKDGRKIIPADGELMFPMEFGGPLYKSRTTTPSPFYGYAASGRASAPPTLGPESDESHLERPEERPRCCSAVSSSLYKFATRDCKNDGEGLASSMKFDTVGPK